MRKNSSLFPIRSLAMPARLGRRQRSLSSSSAALAACVRFEQSNLAVALAARPVWLRGPLFLHPRSSLSSAAARHAA